MVRFGVNFVEGKVFWLGGGCYKYIVVKWFLVDNRNVCFISWRGLFSDIGLKDGLWKC